MKRILVGLDRSEESAFVLAQAVTLARALRAKIRLVRAVPPPVAPAPAMDAWAKTLGAMVDAAERALAERMATVPEELRDGTIVQVGSAADVICAAAGAYDADLVVIGAHHHGVLARALGTTAARVVDHVDRPTLVVRASETSRSTGRDVGDELRAGALLRRDHAKLERLQTELSNAYRSGDWSKVESAWLVWESALREHMKTEQERVFPAFQAVHPAEARRLLEEHDELRRLMDTIGVAIELHAFPAGDARELAARVRAHGAREEVLLYPWMDEALDVRSVRLMGSAA